MVNAVVTNSFLLWIDTTLIEQESVFDGFYAICTNLEVEAFRHAETYNKDKMKGLIDGYDSAMEVYLKEIRS